MNTTTSINGELGKSTPLTRIIDVGVKIDSFPRTATEDHFKEFKIRGTYDYNITRYYSEYFSENSSGQLKICEVLQDGYVFMDIARAILGLDVEKSEGKVDEIADKLVSTKRTFSIGQVEKVIQRFDQGEKSIQLHEGGEYNVFILSDEEKRKNIVIVFWNGRAWKLVHDGGMIVGSIPIGTRVYLLN